MRSVAIIFLSIVLVTASCAKGPSPRGAPEEGQAGPKLWAAVTVTDPVLDRDNLSWDLGFRGPFMFRFYLVNDGDKTINPKIESSRLLINGKDFKGHGQLDWPFIVSNGPRDDRWEALPPGDYLAFGYAMGEYFKEPGRYRVKWQGEGFAAPEVEFRVMPRQHNSK